MDRAVTPNMASIIASDEWIRQVKTEIKRQHISKKELAKIAKVERKTIYAWLDGVYSPRLENVAQICSALGMKEIRLPLTDGGDT